MIFRARHLVTWLPLAMLAHVSGADLQSGRAFMDQGNFSAAENELLPLAANGDPKAEELLGGIYGQKAQTPDASSDVPAKRNARMAEEYFLRAARQGDVAAQTALARLDADRGTLLGPTPLPDMQAYYWSSIALKLNAPDELHAAETKSLVASRLPDDKKAKLDQAVALWKPAPRPAHELPVEIIVKTPCAKDAPLCLGKEAFENRDYPKAKDYFKQVADSPSSVKDRATAQSFLAEIDRLAPPKTDKPDDGAADDSK